MKAIIIPYGSLCDVGFTRSLSGKDDQHRNKGKKLKPNPVPNSDPTPNRVIVTYEILQQGTYSGIKEPLAQIILTRKIGRTSGKARQR
jgi:hypothetical protein